MPNRALQNERFWEFGYFYDAKSIIVSYLDFNSRISLICTSHDFSDRFILDKYDKETNPKDKLTAHARLRKIISVISHYRHMPPLQHLQNLNQTPSTTITNLFLDLNSENYAKIYNEIRNLPGVVSNLVAINQTQLIKATFILETFASENLDSAIRSNNQAMLGLLLANRFVNGTMHQLWQPEIEKCLIYRRTVFRTLSFGLLNLMLNRALLRNYLAGEFGYILQLGQVFGDLCEWVTVSFNLELVIVCLASITTAANRMRIRIRIRIPWLVACFMDLTVVISFAIYFISFCNIVSLIPFFIINAVYTNGLFLLNFFCSGIFLPDSLSTSGGFENLAKFCLVTSLVITTLFLMYLGLSGNTISLLASLMGRSDAWAFNLVEFILGCAQITLIQNHIVDQRQFLPGPLFKKTLLSTPATLLLATLLTPLGGVASALIGIITLSLLTFFSGAYAIISTLWLFECFLRISGEAFGLNTPCYSYQDTIRFLPSFSDIFSVHISAQARINDIFRVIFFPLTSWNLSQTTFLENDLSKYPESEAMMNLAKTVSIAESKADSHFTAKEHIAFLLKENIRQHTSYLPFFRNSNSEETIFLRSLLSRLSDLSIAEIDYEMDAEINKKKTNPISKEFKEIASYVQHVLLPMEERETYQSNPSAIALYDRVPILRRNDTFRYIDVQPSHALA